ncbi:hypothetical protein [Streptomyces sp. DG1A-41]|uniref:hypothetical protein n=1 Tax=Streptomyces sp. DG1A-41 TaxID=3125779 RepID=UPI0030CD89AD
MIALWLGHESTHPSKYVRDQWTWRISNACSKATSTPRALPWPPVLRRPHRQEAVKDAFVTGLHAAIGVAAALTLALGVPAVRWLPREERDTTAEVPDRQEQTVS